jgi:hypothetical protein
MGQRGSGKGNIEDAVIHHQTLLPIKILFENISKRKIFGVYRPSAYIKETGTFFSTLRLDIFKKEIEPGESAVLTGLLESPAGFGHHLKTGAVLSIRSGLDEEGRGLILEIGH